MFVETELAILNRPSTLQQTSPGTEKSHTCPLAEVTDMFLKSETCKSWSSTLRTDALRIYRVKSACMAMYPIYASTDEEFNRERAQKSNLIDDIDECVLRGCFPHSPPQSRPSHLSSSSLPPARMQSSQRPSKPLFPLPFLPSLLHPLSSTVSVSTRDVTSCRPLYFLYSPAHE